MDNLIRIEQIKATKRAWNYIFKTLKLRRAIEARLKYRLGSSYTSWRSKASTSSNNLKSAA